MKTHHIAAPTFGRRNALFGGTALLIAGCLSRALADKTSASKLRELEQKAHGRLGAYVLDPVRGTAFGWRENEHFTHASSFKMSLAAMLLAKADAGQIDLDEILHWTKDDMLPVSPLTKANLDKGLSVRDLGRATLVTSDNTAANVLMRRFGGPSQLTAFWRSIGDTVSRLDRYEPDLNDTPPGTDLDTTTPAAMAATTAAFVHGNVLSAGSRAMLRAWMTDVKTGRDRIRSSFPVDWVSGDKTGTGIGKTKHTYVDLAFGGPAGRGPLIVTAYFEPIRPAKPMDKNAVAVLAAVGHIVAESLSRS
ncbi:class A beta-lactamase [Allorhizobium taibaishanense]|uniref:beta-lactamase n=1 Tax=Allorhizobium taibaishanense TaxID=887144 RepID=A0A7W6HQA9_9HYPH|nr:class A beta-lactamase [Allorhizobium taibaishanense]MBB4009401.1 beta-lactamase class A [Allorhizobium taibaishanense]